MQKWKMRGTAALICVAVGGIADQANAQEAAPGLPWGGIVCLLDANGAPYGGLELTPVDGVTFTPGNGTAVEWPTSVLVVATRTSDGAYLGEDFVDPFMAGCPDGMVLPPDDHATAPFAALVCTAVPGGMIWVLDIAGTDVVGSDPPAGTSTLADTLTVVLLLSDGTQVSKVARQVETCNLNAITGEPNPASPATTGAVDSDGVPLEAGGGPFDGGYNGEYGENRPFVSVLDPQPENVEPVTVDPIPGIPVSYEVARVYRKALGAIQPVWMFWTQPI